MTTQTLNPNDQTLSIKLDNFEGPYDLLLELARAQKVDIMHVSLAAVSQAFMEHIEKNPLPPAVRADFVVVAATLMLLKLQRLMPDLSEEEKEEVEVLTQRVRIYQLYREQAEVWREKWNSAPLLPGPERLQVSQDVPYPSIGVDDMCEWMKGVITRIRLRPEKRQHLRPQGRSLRECERILRSRIKRAKQAVFQELMDEESKQTKAVSLLALLEMAKQGEVRISQACVFEGIIIHNNDG